MTLKFTCQNMYCKIQGYNGNDIDVHMCEFGNRTISHFQFENSNQKWRWGASNKQIKTRWNYPPLWRRLDDYESLRLEGLWVSKLVVLLSKRHKVWRTRSLGLGDEENEFIVGLLMSNSSIMRRDMAPRFLWVWRLCHVEHHDHIQFFHPLEPFTKSTWIFWDKELLAWNAAL